MWTNVNDKLLNIYKYFDTHTHCPHQNKICYTCITLIKQSHITNWITQKSGQRSLSWGEFASFAAVFVVVIVVVFFGWNRLHLLCVPLSIWRWKWDFWCAAVAITWQNCKLSQNATKDDFINRPRRRSTEPVRRDSFEIYQEILFVHICANRERNEFYSTRGFSFLFLAFFLFFFLRFPVREFPIAVRCALNLFLKVRSPGSVCPKLVVASCQVRSYIILSSSSSAADLTNMVMRQCIGKRQCSKRRPY